MYIHGIWVGVTLCQESTLGTYLSVDGALQSVLIHFIHMSVCGRFATLFLMLVLHDKVSLIPGILC